MIITVVFQFEIQALFSSCPETTAHMELKNGHLQYGFKHKKLP
jgi:hypothetical protein